MLKPDGLYKFLIICCLCKFTNPKILNYLDKQKNEINRNNISFALFKKIIFNILKLLKLHKLALNYLFLNQTLHNWNNNIKLLI